MDCPSHQAEGFKILYIRGNLTFDSNEKCSAFWRILPNFHYWISALANNYIEVDYSFYISMSYLEGIYQIFIFLNESNDNT